MDNAKDHYLQQIYPHLPESAHAILANYPAVRFIPQAGDIPLAEHPLMMLVGLTGTGKSTALEEMRQQVTLREDVPSRRELADLVVIPFGQSILNAPIEPVKDREARFAFTRAFHQQVAPGGIAEAFSWLYYAPTDGLTVSEGVRGAHEIRYALEHTRWKIIELWVGHITRLERLSRRRESFDQVESTDVSDLSFLPPNEIAKVQKMLKKGEITPEAIV
ncbi:MAG: hypothetical protein ACOYL5_19865, partial [Phototrophicaceae bacterium]